MRSFIVVGLVSLALMTGCEEPPAQAAIRRAEEWIELGNLDNARAELVAAIREEPRNVRARVLLADISVTQAEQSGFAASRNIEQALALLADAARIQSGGADAERVRERAYDVLNAMLSSGEPNRTRGALAVTQSYPAREASEGLAAAMAIADDGLAETAAAQLASLDPDLVRRTLIGQLEAGAPAVRARAALALWNSERYEPARLIALARYIDLVRASRNLEGARVVAAQASDAGYDDASAAFVAIARAGVENSRNAIAGRAAFEQILAHDGPAAVSLARSLIEGDAADPRTARVCSTLGEALVAALGEDGSPESFDALRGIVGLYVTEYRSRSECLATLFAALERIDGGPWSSIKSYYYEGGWPIFETMIPGRITAMRSSMSSSQTAYAARRWDLFADSASETGRRFAARLQTLGTYDPLRGGRRLVFVPETPAFTSATTCTLRMVVEEEGRSNRRTPVGELVVELGAVASYESQPWQITDIIAFTVDGDDMR